MSYLNDALTRLAAMEEQMVSDSNAEDHAVYWQDGFPYWTNRLTDYAPGEVLADQSQRIYTVDIYYHHGYITADQPGKIEEGILSILPTIQTYFEEHRGLQSTAHPTILDGLDPTETRLLASPVVVNLGKGVAGTDVLGTQIRLQITFNIAINPV